MLVQDDPLEGMSPEVSRSSHRTPWFPQARVRGGQAPWLRACSAGLPLALVPVLQEAQRQAVPSVPPRPSLWCSQVPQVVASPWGHTPCTIFDTWRAGDQRVHQEARRARGHEVDERRRKASPRGHPAPGSGQWQAAGGHSAAEGTKQRSRGGCPAGGPSSGQHSLASGNSRYQGSASVNPLLSDKVQFRRITCVM